MADSMDEIRRKAASAVFALGHRSASKGKMDAHQPPKAGWIPNPSDPACSYIQPEKLNEALAYYDIAIAIASAGDPNRAFAVYTKGLLLEDLGEFEEAESVYQSLIGGPYESSAQLGLRRCHQRRKGTYDIRDEMREGFTHLTQMLGGKPGMSGLLAAMQHVQESLMTHVDTHRTPQAPAAGEHFGGDDADDDAAEEVAQKFVNLLLGRDYAGARQLLHADLSKQTAQNLKRDFEALFAGEEFPESAQVFDSWKDWPDKRAEDIATFYVSIESENAEAVTVIVTRDGQTLRIREVEWGRP